MTDDLRTRIAAVLYRQHYRYGNPDDITWDELETDLKDRYLADADAVIRELGLRLDSTCHIHDREGKQRCHRYVTDWIADE